MTAIRPAAAIRFGCLFVLSLLATSLWAAPADKATLGVFPVYEMGDSRLGTDFAQHLTTMIFRQLQDASFDAVLLNPGGLYSSTPDQEAFDYARNNNCSIALITTLLSTEMPEKGDFIVRVKARLVNTDKGADITSWESTAPVSRHELLTQTVKTYGPGAAQRMPGSTVAAPAVTIAAAYGSNSKPFDKQPLGKTARAIADDIRVHVAADPSGNATHLAPSADAHGSSCNVNFKVSYVAKHAISKSYDVVVNGKEETLSIVDGNLPLTLSPGPVLIQLAVHDAHKIPVQDIYQANTRATCAPDQHTLLLELDTVGEGFLKWQE